LPIEQASDELEEPGLFGRQGGIALGTVHRFQGGERRVVLFSTTVTERSRLAFVDQRVNLLNVAASRAKEHLIVLGHEATLRAGTNTRILVDGQPRLAAAGMAPAHAPGPALRDGLI
jgi:superfamily I DNA and/or RNA helicase